MIDKIKLLLAVLLVVAGVAGFYYFPGQPSIVRALMVIGGLLAATAVFYMTQSGKAFFVYAGESRDEARKVVWPTRKETMQTTGVVMVFVLVMAVFLWIVDSVLLWGIGLAMGGAN
jgi:preprotein translocase subunit SecE